MASASDLRICPESPSITSPGARIRILIADSSQMGCQLLENALKRSRYRFDVVACAMTYRQIANALNQSNVDIALISENLQDGHCMGFQILRELSVSYRKTRIVILLDSPQPDLVVDAFRGGAKGVFCRMERFEALCKCIHAVHNGQIWANSNQLQFILEALVNARPLRAVSAQGLNLLAKREEEVVRLVADGLSNREVASKLGLSEHTVSNYLFRIYDKLGISSRVELVLYVLSRREQEQLPRQEA